VSKTQVLIMGMLVLCIISIYILLLDSDKWFSRDTEKCTSVHKLQLRESYVDIKTVMLQ